MPRRWLNALLVTALLAGCHDGAGSKLVATPTDAATPVATAAPDDTTDADANIDPDGTPDDTPSTGPAADPSPVDPSGAPDAASPRPLDPPARSAVLPNGRKVMPAGKTLTVGNLPYDCALSPDGRWLAVLHGGSRAHGVDLVDTQKQAVVQTLSLKDSFRGLAWAPDGRTLYVSGSSDRFLDVLTLVNGQLTLDHGSPIPGHAAGIAVAADGTPFVADDTTDRLQRIHPDGSPEVYFSVGKTPYAVAVDAQNNAYVACWGDRSLNIVGASDHIASIPVGSHPSAVALRPGHAEAWVANANDDTLSVVDTAGRKVARTVAVSAFPGAPKGASPTALAFAPDGSRLYVALSGANAIAVVDPEAGTELGRIPTAWYPSSVAVSPDGKALYVACAKGFGQGPRRNAPVSSMKGAVSIVPVPDAASLAGLTQRSDTANRFDGSVATSAKFPPIKHVVFVLKENRTYDQVLGDLPRGDGDASLVVYGRTVTPNIHALAERFAFGDHFFCDGEVSAQGHQWAQGAACSDAVERLYPAVYAKEGRWADAAQKALLYPDTDYLIERCVRKRVSVRVYGESLRRDRDVDLKGIKAPGYKGWDLDYPDVKREAAWEAEFKKGVFPTFSHVWLPNDHTQGTALGKPSPRAMVADNDQALGRMMDVLSHDPRWKDTLVIIQEDDAQGGYDHLDGHRSLLVLAGPWVKAGAVTSKHYSQVSVVATVVALLGLDHLSQFDAAAPVIDDVWADTPDMRPFSAIASQVSLAERNLPGAPLAEAFEHFDFGEVDDDDQALLARALWLDGRTARRYQD